MRGEPRDPRDFDPRGGPPPNRQGGGPPAQQGNAGGNVQDALANLLQQVQNQGGPSALQNESMKTQVLEALRHNPQLVQSLVQKMPPSSQHPPQQQQGMPYPQSSMPVPNPNTPMPGMSHQQHPPHNQVGSYLIALRRSLLPNEQVCFASCDVAVLERMSLFC